MDHKRRHHHRRRRADRWVRRHVVELSHGLGHAVLAVGKLVLALVTFNLIKPFIPFMPTHPHG